MPRCLPWALAMATLCSTAAAENDWRLEKEDRGITVHTRAVEGSPHRALRARMVVETPIVELVALLKDEDACSEWVRFCEGAHLHETLSEHQEYIYTVNHMPWPLTDRDVLSRVSWSAKSTTGAVHMEARATEGIVEKRDDRVRLTHARASWIFRPMEGGRVEVITEAHVDPVGPVPAWITNRLLVNAPFATMQQLRELAASGRYAKTSADILPEPSTSAQ